MPRGEDDVLGAGFNELVHVVRHVEGVRQLVDRLRGGAVRVGHQGGHAIAVPDVVAEDAVLEPLPGFAAGRPAGRHLDRSGKRGSPAPGSAGWPPDAGLQRVAIDVDFQRSFPGRRDQPRVAHQMDPQAVRHLGGGKVEHAVVNRDEPRDPHFPGHAQGARAVLDETAGPTGLQDAAAEIDIDRRGTVADREGAHRRNLAGNAHRLRHHEGPVRREAEAGTGGIGDDAFHLRKVRRGFEAGGRGNDGC